MFALTTKMSKSSSLLLVPLILVLTACKIEITVPINATVVSESGSVTCDAGEICSIEVTDTEFNETFIAVPDEGYYFAGWERGAGYLCGGGTEPCVLSTAPLAGNEKLLEFLEQDTSYPLVPRIVPMQSFDFGGTDALMSNILTFSELSGFSLLVVHKDFGVIFEKAYGDFELDRVVQLRSTSKFASATLMMALDYDERVNFDIQAPIGNYLPFDGVYGDRTSEQLLSQTSGIPGNNHAYSYGPHLCQFMATGDFDACGRDIYQYELPGTRPAGTAYSYGGSQWQLAGLAAQYASGKTWARLFRKYIARPCGMEVFEYGNMLSQVQAPLWNGDPASLTGKGNVNLEGGAIGNLGDYGKLLALHLNDGWCGNRRVLGPGMVEFMQKDRRQPAIPPEILYNGYAMGAFVNPVQGSDMPDPVHVTPGGLGTMVWIDSALDYGVVFMAEIEEQAHFNDILAFTGNSVQPRIRKAMKAARDKSMARQ